MALMKAVQINSPGRDFELVQKDVSKPKENEVLIRVEPVAYAMEMRSSKKAAFQDCNIPGFRGTRWSG
jgi:NADPH-dependent curcumin reductase CurA